MDADMYMSPIDDYYDYYGESHEQYNSYGESQHKLMTKTSLKQKFLGVEHFDCKNLECGNTLIFQMTGSIENTGRKMKTQSLRLSSRLTLQVPIASFAK